MNSRAPILAGTSRIARDSIVAESLALCELEGLALVLPQSDIVSVEYGRELPVPLPMEPTIGELQTPQGAWTIYALDRDLRLAIQPPVGRAFAVLLQHPTERLGLLFDSVRLFDGRTQLPLQTLPAVLRDGQHPFSGVARMEAKKLALYCAPRTLIGHVMMLLGEVHSQFASDIPDMEAAYG